MRCSQAGLTCLQSYNALLHCYFTMNIAPRFIFLYKYVVVWASAIILSCIPALQIGVFAICSHLPYQINILNKPIKITEINKVTIKYEYSISTQQRHAYDDIAYIKLSLNIHLFLFTVHSGAKRAVVGRSHADPSLAFTRRCRQSLLDWRRK